MSSTKEVGVQVGAEQRTLDSSQTHVSVAGPEPMVDIELAGLLDEHGAFRNVQVRDEVDSTVVASYADAMRRGQAREFPPIVVYEVMDREGKRYLAAGLHRSTAARHAGLGSIRGYLRQGTWREALGSAVKTNATHGHRPTMGDVCQTLLQLHGDKTYESMSNRGKAALIGVSEGTIRNAYKRLEATAQVTQSERVTVTKKDGKTYALPKKATAQVTQSETTPAMVRGVRQAVPVDDAAALEALQGAMDHARHLVARLRGAGLEDSGVPTSVLRLYQEQCDDWRMDMQTLKTAVKLAHKLSLALTVGKAGKAA